MSKYQEQHYEDVARMLSDQMLDTKVTFNCLAQRFANLFTADNPTQCTHCGDERGTTSICTRPNEGHHFEGGFDRERFLKACGLES